MQVPEASRHPPGRGGNRNGAKIYVQVAQASKHSSDRGGNRNDIFNNNM